MTYKKECLIGLLGVCTEGDDDDLLNVTSLVMSHSHTTNSDL